MPKRLPGKRLDRFMVRSLNCQLLMKPDEGWPTDPIKDYMMIFHYCRNANQYRFDRHYEMFSRNEYFKCGACGELQNTKIAIWGISAFSILERLRIAREMKKEGRWFAYGRAFFGEVRDEYLPPHREGRTSGELESEAIIQVIAPWKNYISDIHRFSGRKPYDW